MLASFSKLVEKAKADLGDGREPRGGDEILAAVPTQPPDPVKAVDVASGAAVTCLGLLGTPFAVLPLARMKLGQFRTRDAGGIEQSKYGSLLLVFRRNRLDLHKLGRRYRPGPFIESLSYDQVESFGRKPGTLAIETWPRLVDGEELLIHGWFERDLRRTLGQLGIDILAIPGAAQPIRRLDQVANAPDANHQLENP